MANAEEIEDLLKEERSFAPSQNMKDAAEIQDEDIYQKAEKDPEGYWSDWAKELSWSKPWTKTLEWNPPHAKWFIDGKLNACYNCVDRHVHPENGGESLRAKPAIIWEGEPGDTRVLTYGDLLQEVTQVSGVFKKLGLVKGDRVAIYLPMIPEAIVAMLACARLGLVHTVVFGGFSAESLSERINDAEAKLLITADFGFRRGGKVLLKEASDEALERTPSIQNVLVVKREMDTPEDDAIAKMKEGRDLWWHEATEEAAAFEGYEEMDAEDLLFILYTSGTTGKPKGIVHSTGGYMTGVYATSKWVFDLKPNDVYWCTADVGWVTGHSYIVYGPLSNGASVFVYEGAPDWPDRERFWKLIDKYKVSIFYTAPTAIRAFMKWGHEALKKYDLSSLRLLGSVGEPINPEAWIWYHENIGRKNCPVVDTWWQTETGAIMVTPLPGITATKPGSATRPFPGISMKVLNQAGDEVSPGGGGYAAITKPWPSMLRTLYKDDARYQETYWSKWPNVYFPGDGAKIDAEGFFWFLGRVDDVMNIAGHRIGTAEVESALVDHPSVAEAAVVGKPHDIKGQAIVAFVILKEARKAGGDDDLVQELKAHIAKKIGAIARPEQIYITADLPKTRSGKIMRRLLRDIAEGKALGDVTTLADPAVIEKLKANYHDE